MNQNLMRHMDNYVRGNSLVTVMNPFALTLTNTIPHLLLSFTLDFLKSLVFPIFVCIKSLEFVDRFAVDSKDRLLRILHDVGNLFPRHSANVSEIKNRVELFFRKLLDRLVRIVVNDSQLITKLVCFLLQL